MNDNFNVNSLFSKILVQIILEYQKIFKEKKNSLINIHSCWFSLTAGCLIKNQTKHINLLMNNQTNNKLHLELNIQMLRTNITETNAIKVFK